MQNPNAESGQIKIPRVDKLKFQEWTKIRRLDNLHHPNNTQQGKNLY